MSELAIFGNPVIRGIQENFIKKNFSMYSWSNVDGRWSNSTASWKNDAGRWSNSTSSWQNGSRWSNSTRS